VTNPEKASDRTLAGQCFCGAVHYAVADEFIYAANCHCSDCRRTTGSAFKPFAGIERDKLVVTKGKDNLMIFGEENGNNTHCIACGSLLYSVVRAGVFVHVAMGTLIDDPTILVSKEQATIALAKVLAKKNPAEARKLLEPLRAERGPVSRAALTALGEMSAQ